jgi:hypothetical protein
MLATPLRFALLVTATASFAACFGSEDDPILPVSRAACEAYCFDLMDVCQGADQQFKDRTFCVEHCADWSGWYAGIAGNRESNDLACRETYVAEAAGGVDVARSCLRAGPTGGDACGTLCENYCDLLEANCAGQPAELPRADCIAKCRNLPKGGGPLDQNGNTVECRIYHLGLAGHNPPESAALHCPHGAIVSTAFCVDPGAADHGGH